MLRRHVNNKRIRQTLHDVFGLDAFRPGQQEAVKALLAGRDVFCLFPTGSGKSLCYQLPAVLLTRPVVVVTPLIALMRDQVRHLTARHIPALCLDSMQTPEELAAGLRRIAAGQVRLIYVSPERLKTPRFREALSAHPPDIVVVDEAHCVVQWGDSFRPAYLEIGDFIRSLPWRPAVCAMTATADLHTRQQIIRSLEMRRPKYITLPLIRPNLVFSVEPTIRCSETILRLAGDEKGLVFCGTRGRTEQMAQSLCRGGIPAAAYHAGMDREERMAVQQRFERGEVRVLAATSAFGMGVDIPDIRFVVMDAMPRNLIDLIQQTGRAGRDGAPARAILLLDPGDVRYLRQYISRAWGRGRKNRSELMPTLREWTDLRRVLSLYLDGGCIPRGLARAFGQRLQPCGQCSACRRAERLGRFTSLAPVPNLLNISEEQLRLWALGMERKALIREQHLPRLGFSYPRMVSAVRSRTVRTQPSWAGEPQRRLQAMLDYLR